MKNTAITLSVLLCLATPIDAFARAFPSTPLPSSEVESLNVQSLELAQQPYLNSQHVASLLRQSESTILGMARGYSTDVRWKDISVDRIGDNSMRLNVHAKIPRPGILRDGNLRVGLYLQRDSQGYFRFVDRDYESSRCGPVCRPKLRRAMNNLPNEYGRFNQVLDSILR